MFGGSAIGATAEACSSEARGWSIDEVQLAEPSQLKMEELILEVLYEPTIASSSRVYNLTLDAHSCGSART